MRKVHVSLGLGAVAGLMFGLGLVMVEPPVARTTSLPDHVLTTVTGTNTNPGYVLNSGGDICGGQNLTGQQVAVYNCPSNPGQTCVTCVGLDFVSGRAVSAGGGTGQPAGGTNNSCASLEKWIGVCHQNNGNYTCDNLVDTTVNCTGTYPPFDTQVIGKAQLRTRYRSDDTFVAPSIAAATNRSVGLPTASAKN